MMDISERVLVLVTVQLGTAGSHTPCTCAPCAVVSVCCCMSFAFQLQAVAHDLHASILQFWAKLATSQAGSS